MSENGQTATGDVEQSAAALSVTVATPCCERPDRYWPHRLWCPLYVEPFEVCARRFDRERAS